MDYELLSPAGDYECFLAAIQAGADAVYLGGNYSARAGAKFSDEEILAAIDYAHLFTRKVYMTLNTVMKNPEMDEIAEYLRPFYEAGLDGVIVQDIGLIRYIKRHFPHLPIHGSTQMAITDAEGVKLLREYGVERVVLARELSLREIEDIHRQDKTELECFIHGALCYSYSGKCLMSSVIGGRSGNRGRCAQPCRLPYNQSYLLSCKDICTLEILPKLCDAGITSFKIEGRLKNPEYVAVTTGIYRKYIDLYLSSPEEYKVDRGDLELLHHLYTRSGNSQGYYFKRNGKEMLTITEPGYMRTSEEEASAARVRFTEKFSLLPVSFELVLSADAESVLTARCNDVCVTVLGDAAGRAINKPITEEDVWKQLRKLGGTEFYPERIDCVMTDDLFLPVSVLNNLRRSAIHQIKDALLNRFRRQSETIYTGPNKDNEQEQNVCELKQGAPLVHVAVTTEEQLSYALKRDDIDLLSVPAYLAYSEIRHIVAALLNQSTKLMIQLPVIARDGYFTKHKRELVHILSEEAVCGVVISNYESLYFLKEIDYTGTILADIHLYALNQEAYLALRSLRVDRTTVPVELNRKELLRRSIAGEDMIIYGRLPVMVSAQCVQKTTGGCVSQNGFVTISDRQNAVFPIFHNCSECTNLIYNSVPISLHKDMDFVGRLNPYSVRFDFTTENCSEMDHILDLFHDASVKEVTVDYDYTKGHLGRGVE